jgi:hypothetical protein
MTKFLSVAEGNVAEGNVAEGSVVEGSPMDIGKIPKQEISTFGATS